jgi:hypothetical protein
MATTLTSCRSSFESSSSVRSKGVDDAAPNKYRRSCWKRSSLSFSKETTSSTQQQYPYPPVSSLLGFLGFAPNEFLPLDHAEREVKRRQRLPLDISHLSDDVLGRCLFSGGYLDSIETARLRGLSQRMRRLASQKVQRLDLRNCHQLTKEHVANIVASFPNLTVRTVGSIQAMILYFLCSQIHTHMFIAALTISVLCRHSTFPIARDLEGTSWNY